MITFITASMQTYNNDNNEMLENAILKMASGNKDALETLYTATKNSVFAFILSMVKNRHEADDVFQDVYISVFEHASSYKPMGKPLGWILTIAKNHCLMYFRRIKNHVDLESVEELWTEDTSIEDKMVLDAAFGKLSDEERNIIFLHVLSGQKHREIAKLLDIPLPTVLSKYHRGLKKLKGFLEENGYE